MEACLGMCGIHGAQGGSWEHGFGGCECRKSEKGLPRGQGGRKIALPSPTCGNKVLTSSQHGYKPGFWTLPPVLTARTEGLYYEVVRSRR